MPSRHLLGTAGFVAAITMGLAACSNDDDARVTRDDIRSVASTTTETTLPAACALITAREMSVLLGTEVDAQGEDDGSTCIYRRESSDQVIVQLEVNWGAGEAAMTGMRLFGRLEPGMREAGVIDPLAGLGDQATAMGPVLMVRTGEDLVTLTFQDVSDPPATARRVIDTVRPRMGPTSRAATSAPAAASSTEPSASISGDARNALGGLFDLLGDASSRLRTGEPELPSDLATLFHATPATGVPCSAGGREGLSEMAAESGALVPLTVGQTIADTWRRNERDHDNECLTHVTAIDGDSISWSMSCPKVANRKEVTMGRRRVCRTDLREGLFYLEGYDRRSPDVVAGATMISLSRRQLEELKGASGQTWFRYFQLVDVDERSLPGNDRYGQIRRVSVGTRTLNVNDEQKSLPALNVEGMLYKRGGDDPVTLKLTVLDDARFPLVLDFEFPQWGFAIHRSKVTYPSTGRLEQQLAAEKRVDVYGIYFDTASATLRPESEPVLVEIAGVLRQHKDWRLRIDGHTDSIGTPESNLELSQRRAESVKAALIARHGLTSDRFTTGGHGARVPKDTNDTPDGRARNRRVELVRQ